MATAERSDRTAPATGARRDASTRRRLTAAARAAGPPVLVFLLVELAVCLAALGAGGAPLNATTWLHYDAINYLQIATRGYENYDCSTRGVGTAGVTCGNGAWFPGIAWLTQLVGLLGLSSPTTTMLVLARAFTLGTLVLVWTGLLDQKRTASGYAALTFAAVCPGAVWFHAQFPISMATFGLVGALVAVRRDRPWLAAAAGFLATTAYTTVVLAGPLLAVWVYARSRPHPGRPSLRLERAGIVGAGFLAGGGVVLLVMRLQSGIWDGFFRSQERFAYVHEFPLVAWWDRTRPLFDGAVGTPALTAFQTGFVGLLVMGSVVWAIRRRARDLELFVVAYAVVFWLFPLYQGALSNYRSDALLLPLVVVIARLRPWLAVLLAGTSAALLLPLTASYVQNLLI